MAHALFTKPLEKLDIRTELFEYVSTSIIEGKFSEIHQNLHELESRLKFKYSDQYEDIALEYGYGYEGDSTIRVYGLRKESDTEFEKRKQTIINNINKKELAKSKRLETKKERDLKLLKELLEKYPHEII